MPFLPISPASLNSIEDVRQWVEDELSNITLSDTNRQELVINPVYRAPEKPREGTLIFADGANYNPGSGKGTYEFVGVNWRKLGGAYLGESIEYYGANSGATGAENAAAIQAAIDATPYGGVLWIPAKTFKVTAQSLITKPIHIRGLGYGSIFDITGMPATDDLFKVQTTAFVPGFSFKDFFVTATSGNPGRYVLEFAGANGAYRVDIENIQSFVITSTGYAFGVNGSAGSGGIAYSTIANCNVFGMFLGTMGDGITLRENVISTSNHTSVGVYYNAVVGAAGFSMRDNVVSGDSTLLTVDRAVGPLFEGNEFETGPGPFFLTGAACMLGLGAAGINCLAPQWKSNHISVLSSTVGIAGLYLDRCLNANIEGGEIIIPAGGSSVVITANAQDTTLDIGSATSYISPALNTPVIVDSGVRTSFVPNFGNALATAGELAYWEDGKKIGVLTKGQIPGSLTNSNANAGNVGEFMSVFNGTPIALTTGVEANATSLILTAGDWWIDGYVNYNVNAATNIAAGHSSISLTSATAGVDVIFLQVAAAGFLGFFGTLVIPPQRLSLAAAATVFLVASAIFGGGTGVTVTGGMKAWRAR